MLSIERLYIMQAIKTVSCETQHGKGRSQFDREDALAVISKVESKYVVGSAVLSSSIAMLKDYDKFLERALSGMNPNIDPELSRALAQVAVSEVCNPGVCPRCNGTKVFNRVNVGLVECSRCGGTGVFRYSTRMVHGEVVGRLPGGKKFSRGTFSSKWQPVYLAMVEKLHIESGEAARLAVSILEGISVELQSKDLDGLRL